MLNRIVYGCVAILALLTAVAADTFLAHTAYRHPLLADLLRAGSIIPVTFTLILLLGVLELLRLLRTVGLRPAGAWAGVACATLMLSPWLCAGRVLGNSPVDVEGLHWQIVWVAAAFFGAAWVHLRRGVTPAAMGDLAATVLTITYLGVLPSFAIQMRCDANIGHPTAGAWTLLIVLAVIFASDIAALYVGKALGRRKLAPTISPGKSVAGFLGGVGGSVAAAAAFWTISYVAPPQEEISTLGQHLAQLAEEVGYVFTRLDLSQAVMFGIAVSAASQVGDLFESWLKRSAQVKDSSQLIPGMGGVLDVVDGTVFAVPLAWFLLTRVWQVV